MRGNVFGRLAVLVPVLLCGACAVAAVKPGENLVLNGRLEADQVDLPLNWTVDAGSASPKWLPSGGPRGIPAIRFYRPDALRKSITYRQYGLGLSPNGSYRLTFWARTKGLRGRAACVVINLGWSKSGGVRDFPADSDWTKYEATFRGFPSDDGNHQLAFTANLDAGTIDFADVRLEAADEAALRETRRSVLLLAAERPRFVPWKPLLHDIDRTDPRLTFRFFGKPLEAAGGYEAVLTVGGRTVTKPLAQYLDYRLPQPAAEGLLTIALRDRKGGTNVCEKTFPYGLADHPKVSTAGHRKLNNLVTEVLAANLADAAESAHVFSTVRRGWIFLRVSAEAKDGFSVSLDGREVMDREAPAQETVRYVPSGEHKLVVRGAGAGKLVVRSIPELRWGSLHYSQWVDTDRTDRWEFQKRHIVPSITSYDGDNLTDEQAGWFRRQGRFVCPAFHTVGVRTADELVRTLESAPGMTLDRFDGGSLDEQSFGKPEHLAAVTDGLWQFMAKHPECARFPASATIGKPSNEGLDQDYLAAAANLCHGHGLIEIEAYYRGKATEEEAQQYVFDYGGDIVCKYREWYPPSVASTLVLLGAFTQTPTLTLNHYPETDYKRFLDLQMHAVATSSKFEGLGGIGYWGTHYADEEMNRWAAHILRHYAIEGRTDRPSDAFGFTYNPNHLRNGDFRGTLEPWKVRGDVGTDRKEGFGWGVLKRYGGNGGLGDTFAVFRRGAVTNHLGQVATGLVPGKWYALRYAMFDAKDARSDTCAPKPIPLDVRLGSGAEIDESRSWTWVDDHRPSWRDRERHCRASVGRVVFRATSDRVPIAFSDGAAAPGDEIGLNSVSLDPYFREDR